MELSGRGVDAYHRSLRYPKPAMVIWPETLLARPFEEYRSFFAKNPKNIPLLPFLEEKELCLLTGAPLVLDWESYEAANGVILIDPRGVVLDRYAKQHLVPFAEAIPFIEKPWMAFFMRNIVGYNGGWTAGKEARIMELPLGGGKSLRFGTPVCFEDAFASLCRDFYRKGADILINLTDDSWSKRNSAQTQHFAAARFRTVENRRVLVRAANSGLSVVVDAQGRITASLPGFTPAFLAAEVPVQISGRPTIYNALGDWFPLCLLAAFLAALVLDRLFRPLNTW
jgi:apolipoprotein N-acyltransferase